MSVKLLLDENLSPTTLPLPASWHVELDEDLMVAREPSGAVIVVRSSQGALSADTMLHHLARAHELATAGRPRQIEVRELSIDAAGAIARYVADAPDAVERRLLYRAVVRDGASCEIAIVEPAVVAPANSRNLLGAIEDTAWADAAPGPTRPEDPTWSLIRGLLSIGVHVLVP